MLLEQEPEAAPTTGAETAADIKTDYSRATSRQITTYLNRDHRIIQRLLQQSGSGGSGSGPGRFTGRDYTEGRVTPAQPDDLLLYVPNAVYAIAGELVEVDGPGGFVPIPVPPNLDGRFGLLSKTEAGGVTILPEHWLEPTEAGAPPEEPDIYPVVGLVTSDGGRVVSVDYTHTDEIMAPSQLLLLIRNLQRQIDALLTPNENGETPGGIISRGDLIPWDATDLDRSIKATTLSLLDDLRAEMRDYVDSGRSKAMQTDNDAFVEALMRIYASLARIAPEATDLVEAAMVLVGYAGHSRSGAFEEPGINGTTNHLRFTTMDIDLHGRGMRP